jgi:hypothetical protein
VIDTTEKVMPRNSRSRHWPPLSGGEMDGL